MHFELYLRDEKQMRITNCLYLLTSGVQNMAGYDRDMEETDSLTKTLV